MTTLGFLFIKYKFPNILFKNKNKKFICPLDSIEIKFLHNFGHGVFPTNLHQINIDKIFQDNDSSFNELEYPQILELNINLQSFYDFASLSLEKQWCSTELSIAQHYYSNIIIANDYDKQKINIINKIIFNNYFNTSTQLSKDLIPKFIVTVEEKNNDSILEKNLKISNGNNAKIIFKYNKENYKNLGEIFKGFGDILFESSLNL